MLGMDANPVIRPGVRGPKSPLTDKDIEAFAFEYCDPNGNRTDLALLYGKGLSRSQVFRRVTQFIESNPDFLKEEAARRGIELPEWAK